MVAYERILVPTDGSPGTAETVAHGLAVAGEHGAAVHALYVVDKKAAVRGRGRARGGGV